MKIRRKLSLIFALAAMFGPLSGIAHAQSLVEKASLQAAMQRHIDRNTIDGLFLYFDTASQSVRRLHPVTTHPMILTMDQYYVLCYDFRDDAGKNVNVDFFMAPRADSYVVFHTVADGDTLLHQLVNDGRARPVQ